MSELRIASWPRGDEPPIERSKSARAARLGQVAIVACGLCLTGIGSAWADEGGVSFWLPGQYGSLAALPGTPGLALGVVYYHTSVDADRSRSFIVNGRVRVGVSGRADLAVVAPSYTFADPVLGAQLAISLGLAFGNNNSSISATLIGPRGNQVSGRLSESRFALGDLYPTATLKWNFGVHNVMAYLAGDIPTGTYDTSHLSNLSIGHGAIDGGFGYTYFDPTKGHEFSVVSGLTFNLKNPSTDYRNGVDWHVDWAASQFLSKNVHVGVAGYFYQQISDDSGSGATLGGFRSRVAGVGPQIGFLFPIGDMQGYLNLKGYGEFANQNRPKGWNVWLSFQISPASRPGAPPQIAVVRK